MLEMAQGWQMDVDFGTDWMFIRICRDGYDAETSPPLAERAWLLAEQSGINRIVIEVDDATLLSSHLVGQLVLLHKRAHLSSGVMRLCDFSYKNYRVIEQMRLTDRFPNYQNREQAVMGFRPNTHPNKPR